MNLTMKEQFHLGIVNGQLDVVEDILDTSPSLVHYVDEVRLFVICVTCLFCMSWFDHNLSFVNLIIYRVSSKRIPVFLVTSKRIKLYNRNKFH